MKTVDLTTRQAKVLVTKTAFMSKTLRRLAGHVITGNSELAIHEINNSNLSRPIAFVEYLAGRKLSLEERNAFLECRSDVPNADLAECYQYGIAIKDIIQTTRAWLNPKFRAISGIGQTELVTRLNRFAAIIDRIEVKMQ